MVDETSLGRRLAFGREMRACIPILAACFVGGNEQLLAALQERIAEPNPREDGRSNNLETKVSHARRKHFLYWVTSAKREATRLERIMHTVRCMRAGLTVPQKVDA